MNKKLDLSVLYWFTALSVVLIGLFGAAVYRDNHREWMLTQNAYNDLLVARWEKAKLDAQSANQEIPAHPMLEAIAVKQIQALDLKRVDRCTSCHISIDDKTFAEEKQPFKAHSNLDLITVNHPTEKFGCTSCHHGQGLGTTAESAHGFVHKWDYPMLGDRKNLTKFVQASCAQCHTDPTKWVAIGAPKLARGHQLFQKNNCNTCHKVGDMGGAIGPELTFEGDKVPEQFSFTLLKENLEKGTFGEEAKKTHLHNDIVDWQYYHFKNPQAVSSGSVMPNFGFSDEDIEAITTYVLSLQRPTVPTALTTNDAKVTAAALKETKPAPQAEAKPAAKLSAADLAKKGEQVYTATCAACHQANGQGLPNTFPPLAGSEFVNGDANKHIEIVLKGLTGPITVLGKPYNSAMPPQAQLSDEDIAAVVTYERTAWGNKGGAVTPEQVKALR